MRAVFLCVLLASLSACNDDVTGPANRIQSLGSVSMEGVLETQLTSGPAGDGSPRWSPDGKTIVFDRWTIALNPWSGEGNIWTVSSAGGTPQKLTSYVNDYDASWSPNGKELLFGSTRSGSNDLWVLSLRDSALVNLIALPRNDLNPRWSPNGKMIAFTSDSHVGPFGVWLYVSKEKQAWPVLTDARYSFNVCDWAPNGKMLAIWGGKEGELWLMPTSGTPLTRLTFDGDRFFDGSAAFSPDGSTLAFCSDRTGDYEIWLLDLATLAVAQLTSNPSYDLDPDWSPDGHRIVYSSSRTGSGDLWILDVPKHPKWIPQPIAE